MATRSPRRVSVRRSGVHGRGVFAQVAIARGEEILPYKGALIAWQEAERRHAESGGDPHHTFLFQVDGGMVIDGGTGGNSARWINHSCAPNCEAQEDDRQRIVIVALRDIAPGEELFFDYALEIVEKPTKALRQAYACLCGTPQCRGTMLAPRRRPSKPS